VTDRYVRPDWFTANLFNPLVSASGEGELWLGPRRQPIKVLELQDAEKPEVLRAYLRKWKWEVGQFFEGVGPDASEEDMKQATPKHPIFRIL
jgi:hypothetical protein